MTLDIVIPALNEHENLKKLLPFLREHSKENSTNIIVVDAKNSKDTTEALCKDWNCHYQKSENCQRASQLNEGAAISKADSIIFLHADVFPPKSFVQDIENCLITGNDCGMFCYRFDKARLLMKVNQYFTRFDSSLSGGGDQCFFILKSVFDQHNGFDESFCLMEDFELFRRLKKEGARYEIVQSPAIVSSRKYENNSWLRVNIVNFLTFQKFKKSLPSKELSQFYKKWLRPF